MGIIQIEHVSKTFNTGNGTINALRDVSLDIEAGDIYGIIGMSGAGKSTLVRCINHIEVPTEGKVIVQNKDLGTLSQKELRKQREHIGMIFQHFNLLMQKSVLDNVCFPLFIQGKSKADAKKRALDPQTTSSILELLKDINSRFGITIVVITHQMAVVREICNQVAIMKDGQVVEHGRTTDIFAHPKSDVAKELLSKDEGSDAEKSWAGTTESIQNGTRIRIVYTENSAFEPVIANIILKFREPINILKASTKNVGGVAKGEMILELPKGSANVSAMEDYLRERGLELEELDSNVTGGDGHVD